MKAQSAGASIVLLVGVAGAALGQTGPVLGPATSRVSVGSAGEQGSGSSTLPSISATDGRYVAFASGAALVPADTNVYGDVYVHDRLSGITELVSVSNTGAPGNGGSNSPSISADGRYVAFASGATNLVPGDTNGSSDVFVRDRLGGPSGIQRVSLSSAGVQGDGLSDSPSISADGRFVAFRSYAGNLVSMDSNGWPDIFVRDRQSGTTERVNVSSTGKQAIGDESSSPSISGNGRYVAFYSGAPNLVEPKTSNGQVFVRDRTSKTTELVSLSSAEEQGNGLSNSPSISADGRYVAFRSDATNLLPAGEDSNLKGDIFVRDRLGGTTERVSVSTAGVQGDGASDAPSISADGRYVAFRSAATNLKLGDTTSFQDVFVRDRFSVTTKLASVNSTGTQGNSHSRSPSISADGRYVAFQSLATNFVPAQDGGDTNGMSDIFVRLMFRR